MNPKVGQRYRRDDREYELEVRAIVDGVAIVTDGSGLEIVDLEGEGWEEAEPLPSWSNPTPVVGYGLVDPDGVVFTTFYVTREAAETAAGTAGYPATVQLAVTPITGTAVAV